MKDFRKIKLSNGEVLEVDMTEGFYDLLRKKLFLDPSSKITDEQIKKFFILALTDYISKNEAA